MDARANKNRLIQSLRIERARWDMLLVQVDTSKMTTPGVSGHLSMRDILADVVRQEKWVASQLRLDAMEQAAAEPGPNADVEHDAEESVGSLSVSELMEESRQAFDQIVKTLMRLPAEAIFSPQSAEWTHGDPVSSVVPAHTVEHYRKYHESIRSWMTRRRRRRTQARTA